MEFFLGILAILQITAFPGLILYKFARLRGNFLDGLLIVFGLSFISNFCLVFLLSVIGIYTRGIFIVFLLVEFLGLIWLYRDNLRASLETALTTAWNHLTSTFENVLSKREQNREVSILSFAWLALVLFFALQSMVWVSNVFSANLGTVFRAWDAVVSWNRWATVWAAGQVPLDSRFYPQLIPANWSITYILLGDTTLQFFAKSIMPLFAILIIIGLLRLGMETREVQFFVTLALLGPLLKHFLIDGISNGYVDIAIAFWGFMAVYVLLRARQMPEFEQRYRWLLLGAVFVSGAALTKQTGVYLALCYPILAWASVGSLDISLWRARLQGLISSASLIYLLWISWYVFKGIQILMGEDRANLEELVSLSSNIYGNVGLFQQILAAMARFDKFLLLFVAIAVAFPFMDRLYRLLTILMMPYPLIWAWLAGYDTRNLAIFLPAFALLSGFSADVLAHKVLDLLVRIKTLRMPVYMPLLLGVAGLIGLGFWLSPQLAERQIAQQKENFSPKTNQVLYELVAAENSQTKILTNYPMEYLPGLQEYQVRFNFGDWGIFKSHLENPEIEYLLVPNSALSEIRDYIDARITDGSYEVVLVNKEWKRFTLIKILDR